MRGFTAALVRNFSGAVCAGRGPTSVAVVGSTVYFAAGEEIYAVGGGRTLGSAKGSVGPWGLAVTGGKMYATTPGCGSDATQAAVDDNCNVVEIRPDNARVVGEVSTACGFALAAIPGTPGQLTVGGRDGRVVTVRIDNGSDADVLMQLGSDPAVSLVWSPDGARLFVAQQSGKASVWTKRNRSMRPLDTGRTSALATGDGVNMNGSVLAAGDGPSPVKAVPFEDGAPSGDVAASSSSAAVMVAAPDGIYVAQPNEIWLLRGRYSPPPPGQPPPPGAPPTTIRARVTPTSIVQGVAPAPPVQAPPPPPPPAPPAPPLATAAQVVAQPSAVANPAIVPGESEREAAMRLAATGRPRPLAPYLLWLALAAVVCGGGLGAGAAAGRHSRSDAGRYAWAETR